MKKNYSPLNREQYIGAAILFSIAIGAWLFVALWPQKPLPEMPDVISTNNDSIRQMRWEHKKDSFRRADSIRYAQWAAEREQRYDSFRHVDSLRFIQWSAERQLRYDSFRLADSLWRDSVGWRYPKHIKKDTILNLNTADTTELQYIRGIGRYTARQIIAYRDRLGGFYSVTQLSDSTLARFHVDTLQAHFFVLPNEVKQIPINHCSLNTLARHPYLRYAQAKAIYELRRKRISLDSIDELSTLPQLSTEDLTRLAPYLCFE